MKIIVNGLRHRLGDAGRALEILERGGFHRLPGAEVHQQRPLAARSDPGDVIERTCRHALRPLLPVSADREAMGFIAQALQVEKHR